MIITICGSFKFKKEMWDCYKRLSNKKFLVFLPSIDCDGLTKDELRELHFEKIKISDVVFIIDVGGYIGNGTKEEIEYAKSLGKMVIYLSEVIA